MTHYRRWTEADGDMWPGLVEEWTEIGADGVVTRELGFNADGDISHQFPSDYFPQGSYGIFDLAVIETRGLIDTVEAAEFERKWDQGLRETKGRPRPPDAFDRLIARVSRAFRNR